MAFPRRSLIAMAILFFFSVLSVAAASSELDVVTNLTIIPATNISIIPHSDSIVARDRNDFKDMWKMPTEWKGEATIEVYIVSDAVVNVGNVTGSNLYGTIYERLERHCPARVGKSDKHKCGDGPWPFKVEYKEDDNEYQSSYDQVEIISSKWTDTQTRNLLFGAIAGAYQGMSENQRNCYNSRNPATDFRYCNVALRVGAYTPDSHLYVMVRSDILDDNDGTFRCCESRSNVDNKLDELKLELESVYPTQPSRKFRNVACHLGCGDNERVNGDLERGETIDVDKLVSERMKNTRF